MAKGREPRIKNLHSSKTPAGIAANAAPNYDLMPPIFSLERVQPTDYCLSNLFDILPALKGEDSSGETLMSERENVLSRSKDLMFLIGNLHRFQHRWIIGSLIYPPKITQPSLF